MFLVSKNACRGSDLLPLGPHRLQYGAEGVMARPKKADPERRDERLAGLRLTAAERAVVEAQAAAAGLDLPTYQRSRLLNQRPPVARSTPDAALLVELNRIGVNLNQIARAVNRGRDLPDHFPAVLKTLEAAVEKVALHGS